MPIFTRQGSCEGCDQYAFLAYCDQKDDYRCNSCLANAEEDAYQRQQERNMEDPPETMREEQLRTWDEHQKAHKR